MRRVVALALCLAALAVVPEAGAVIVPQRGMAGVELELTRSAVRTFLGAPLRVVRGRNDFGPWVEFRYAYLVRVFFQSGDLATAISTTGRRERTGKGTGVGSTRAQLRSAHPRVRCEGDADGHCFLGRFLPGQRVTDFLLRDGRVARVTVGFVID